MPERLFNLRNNRGAAAQSSGAVALADQIGRRVNLSLRGENSELIKGQFARLIYLDFSHMVIGRHRDPRIGNDSNRQQNLVSTFDTLAQQVPFMRAVKRPLPESLFRDNAPT